MSEQRTAIEDDAPLGLREERSGRISSPPPLRLPFAGDASPFGERGNLPPAAPTNAPANIAEPIRSVPVSSPRRNVEAEPEYTTSFAPDPPAEVRPPVTFSAPPIPAPAGTAQKESEKLDRVTAERLANPSYTVPQGTVIAAVLETALDSTRPGGVRALVQRNIHGFDGSHVLIPRGSRLYGEYDAELQRGQNRALIRWTRLIRPDGVTIALDSPASDPLGRAGVKGKVNSKFFQRFGGALLQSVLDIGVGVATREASDGVIVALPGSTQNVTPRVTEGEIRPTLKVRHGTSVSVFVSRDLDFTSVEF
nr:TrbI/VirB10 family protein [Erythrobacter sp. SAORIC-644]